MTCYEVINLLPEYLIGELPDDQDRAIRDHIVRCPSCESEFARMQSVVRRISMGPAPVPPGSYFSRFPDEVMKRIDKSIPRKRADRHRRHVGRVVFTSGAVAAAVILVLLFIWPNGHFAGPGDALRRDTLTEVAVVGGPSDEELAREIGLLDIPETGGTVDLLYSDDPWDTLPDISDTEWEKLLVEILQESS